MLPSGCQGDRRPGAPTRGRQADRPEADSRTREAKATPINNRQCLMAPRQKQVEPRRPVVDAGLTRAANAKGNGLRPKATRFLTEARPKRYRREVRNTLADEARLRADEIGPSSTRGRGRIPNGSTGGRFNQEPKNETEPKEN